MRGKPFVFFCVLVGVRITPADAGKTRSASDVSIVSRDHPRGCGENNVFVMMVWITLGSPPRMRGKLPTLHLLKLHNGITPADAGKTKHKTLSHSLHKDHPRGCGENFQVWVVQLAVYGSPPRMRGKL